MECKTVKIKQGDDYTVINEEDFVEGKMELYVDPEEKTEGGEEKAESKTRTRPRPQA